MPHGHCYLWTPGLIKLHVISDVAIALAYFSIPLTLGWFVRRRRDIDFGWMFILFGVFILACGMTHVMEVWNIWHSIYWLSGTVKAITAVASVPTAILLTKLMPQALLVPSPRQLQVINRTLEEEVRTRRTAEEKLRELNAELESRVAHRTADLETANAELRRLLEEQRSAEGQMRKMLMELEHSNQELGQFAYVASHDLKEPLRAITSCVQLLRKGYSEKLDARGLEFVDHSVDGAKRMQQLIDDLLSYSRLEQQGSELQPIGFSAPVQHACENLEAAIAESGVQIHIGSLPTLRCHFAQMVQLFQNLIGNAVKFRREQAPEVWISAERKNGDWLFSVRDNGIGFEPEFNERIFGLFQRLHTRRKYNGTGIGLAICKKIVERHQGCIWAESQPGRGTTFFFTLPE